MKKLLFIFAALTAISFASCGNRTESNESSNDTATVDTLDSVVLDTVCC